MKEYNLRLAVPSDFPALARLWEFVFGDGKDFTDEFFRVMWVPGCCHVAEADNEIVSMGFCLTGPVAGGYKCGYIYAMATYPEHRGNGLAAKIGRALVSSAFENGSDIVATLPAEESLNVWYETRLYMIPTFKKGGEGVVFPANWRSFAAFCGEHDPSTPNILLAVARSGASLSRVNGLGWEITFD